MISVSLMAYYYMGQKRDNGPKMESLVLSTTSANQDLESYLSTVSASPRSVTVTGQSGVTRLAPGR